MKPRGLESWQDILGDDRQLRGKPEFPGSAWMAGLIQPMHPGGTALDEPPRPNSTDRGTTEGEVLLQSPTDHGGRGVSKPVESCGAESWGALLGDGRRLSRKPIWDWPEATPKAPDQAGIQPTEHWGTASGEPPQPVDRAPRPRPSATKGEVLLQSPTGHGGQGVSKPAEPTRAPLDTLPQQHPTDYAVVPRCVRCDRPMEYDIGCDWDHCCKRGSNTECQEHDEECDRRTAAEAIQRSSNQPRRNRAAEEQQPEGKLTSASALERGPPPKRAVPRARDRRIAPLL